MESVNLDNFQRAWNSRRMIGFPEFLSKHKFKGDQK